jgi:lipopolysaccharide transport system ATP-binding protein
MSSDLVIEARGLGKAYEIYKQPGDRVKQLLRGKGKRYYEEFWALRDIDLAVRRHETLGIIGPNGAGKSTLLQLLCGTVAATEGELRINGKIAAMLQLGAGFHPEFTGRENVYLCATLLGLSRREIAQRFDAIAKFAAIGAFMEQPVKQYSSGMYARLAFSVYANVDADILVVDEILAVGDGAFQQKCARFLQRYRQRGTLLFVSHDAAAVTRLCDRVIWLDGGRLKGVGTAKEMCHRYYVAASSVAARDNSGFRSGGRDIDADPMLSTFDLTTTPAPAPGIFDADPDDVQPPDGGATIESAAFDNADGANLPATGGEEVTLRIVCRLARDVARPVIAFAVRDRLDQYLFGDNSYPGDAAAAEPMAAGATATAAFRFVLPYLPTGVYAVEAMIYDGTPSDHVLLDRADAVCFIDVTSTHISQGLVNVAMRAVSVERGPVPAAARAAREELGSDAA